MEDTPAPRRPAPAGNARAARREKLRERLIEAAESLIREGGIEAVKARDLARMAGCSLGAIYTVFDDLDQLVMAVNGRTFRRLGAVVAASQEGAESLPPTERLIRMACAYLGFAAEHNNLWRTLFDFEMSTEGPVPEWYLEELSRLFDHIRAPLREIFPEMSEEERDLMTRTLFSAVHGIVLLGLERRISAVPREKLETMIRMLLCQIGNR